MTTALYLLNRAPTKVLGNKTLYEAYTSLKLAVRYFKTFGCLAFIKNTCLGLKKLDNMSTLMVFIGYSEGAKAYRLLDPRSR